jgi:hypothetical protein
MYWLHLKPEDQRQATTACSVQLHLFCEATLRDSMFVCLQASQIRAQSFCTNFLLTQRSSDAVYHALKTSLSSGKHQLAFPAAVNHKLMLQIDFTSPAAPALPGTALCSLGDPP